MNSLRTRTEAWLHRLSLRNSPSLMAVWGACMALLISGYIYHGFITNYTVNVFSEKSFDAQYLNTIYRYRVLGVWLMKGIYALLKAVPLAAQPVPSTLLALDPAADWQFYQVYVVLNTFALVAMSIVWGRMLRNAHLMLLSPSEQWLLMLGTLLLIGLTEFVVTPYDITSYLLHLMALSLYLAYLTGHRALHKWLSLAVIVLATLNRESSALIVSAIIAMEWYRQPTVAAMIRALVAPVLAFVVPYVLLRVFLPSSDYVFILILIHHNLTQLKALSGILFGGAMLVWLLAGYTLPTHVPLFWLGLLASTPYLVVCLTTGYLFEIRLFVPLMLNGMILGRLNMHAVLGRANVG